MANTTNKYDNIPAEKFQFAKKTDYSHDKKLDTKPVSYFQGAFRRFAKNKGAVVGGIVILCLVLYAIFAPIISPYTIEDTDDTRFSPSLSFVAIADPKTRLHPDLYALLLNRGLLFSGVGDIVLPL